MNIAPKKKPFSQLDFLSTRGASTTSREYSNKNELLICFCKKNDGKLLICMSCGIQVHHCLQPKNNRSKGTQFQCTSCLNLAMDPIYQVRKTFLKTYFSFSNIFTTSNQFSFYFKMDYSDLDFPVEIRAIKAEQIDLSWPMLGSFTMNNEKEPFFELKPLLCNSNRKARKQQYITIPRDQLKYGQNVLHFKIYCIDRQRYQDRYKVQQNGRYFLSINSITQIEAPQLVNQTFQRRRVEKTQSLRLLNPNKISGIQIGQAKINLICPYTKSRIKVPVRGKYCLHYSCVCLQTMIAFHSNLRAWTCPLCDERLNEPYVDIFIYKILLDNTRNGSDVFLSPDGSYRWVTAPQAVDLDDSDSDECTMNPDSVDPAPLPPPLEEVAPTQLILSEREEEVLSRKMEERKKKRQMVKIKVIQALKKGTIGTQDKDTSSTAAKEVPKVPIKEISQCTKNEPPKSIKKDPRQPLRKLVEVPLLQCTQITKKSYITRQFLSKTNRTQLARKHQETIKKSTILKCFFGELI